MSYFESSVRVPMFIHHPHQFEPHRVSQNVSTLDILPTMCDLVGTKPHPDLPMDGVSLLPHLEGQEGHDKVYAEYTGEGTIAPLMMIREGPWKFITCPTDGIQLFNLQNDPREVKDLAKLTKETAQSEEDKQALAKLGEYVAESNKRWDFDAITKQVLQSQRQRRLVWGSLKQGAFTSWDFNPNDDGRLK